MTDVQQISLTTITGTKASLGDFAGDVLLIVNVASRCGLTPQYTALQELHESRKESGFSVLGFPANNFGSQEPGSHEEIAEFCETTYSVTFPMFSKVSVLGDDQHPLYRSLTQAMPHSIGDKQAFRDRLKGYGITPSEDPDVLWNFEKFLLDREGNVVARFAPRITPDDPVLVGAIDEQLLR